MSIEPRERDVPLIPGALQMYRIAAFVTGALLIGLVVEMIVKYGFRVVIEFGGNSGGFGIVPDGNVTGLNTFTLFAMVHGWFYVLYLLACFRLWSRMRWSVVRLLLLALGGIVPFLSFFMESRIAQEVKAYLAHRKQSYTKLKESH